MSVEYVEPNTVEMYGKDLQDWMLRGCVVLVQPMYSELWLRVYKEDLIRQLHAYGWDLMVNIVYEASEARVTLRD